MTFIWFMVTVAACVGVTVYVCSIFLGEHYHRRFAERDAALLSRHAALLSRRCVALDGDLRRRHRADELELAQIRDKLTELQGALQQTGPDWARGYQQVAAEELGRELEQVAELRQQLGQMLEAASLQIALLENRNEEHSRVRGTGSEPPS